jgi:hypothetical protein
MVALCQNATISDRWILSQVIDILHCKLYDKP